MFIKKRLRNKLHPELIVAALDTIIQTDDSFLHNKYNVKRIATVQRKIKAIKTIDDFVFDLYQFIKNAAEQEAQYIIFPEYNFFDLFHLLPGLSYVDRYLNRRSQQKTKRALNKGNVHLQSNHTLKKLFHLMAEPSEIALLTLMKRLAQHFRMYIYTGTYIHKKGNHLVNRGTFINPDGEIMLHQDKVHLTDFEASIGLARENRIQVIDLPIGKIAIPICMDASYFETFKLATSLQAEIVIIPIANNEAYQKWRAMRGIWGRVQETYVYGVKSSLNGWLGGMQFTGKAGFFAPCEMTKHFDGIVQIAPEPYGDYVIVNDLDVTQLRQVRHNATYFGDKNEVFEKNYFKKTYVTNKEGLHDAF